MKHIDSGAKATAFGECPLGNRRARPVRGLSLSAVPVTNDALARVAQGDCEVWSDVGYIWKRPMEPAYGLGRRDVGDREDV